MRLTVYSGAIASCVRFAIFFQSEALEDPTWKSAFLNVWTVVEPGTYLIAACLPALRPLMMTLVRRFGSALSSRSRGAADGPIGNGGRSGYKTKPNGSLGRFPTSTIARPIGRLPESTNEERLDRESYELRLLPTRRASYNKHELKFEAERRGILITSDVIITSSSTIDHDTASSDKVNQVTSL